MTLGRDLRYALRGLSRNPGFTAVALATLALGIGANTAIFSVVDGVLLRPLPYADSERLLTREHNLSPPELADVAVMARSFESVGGAALQPYDLKTGPEPIQGVSAMASGALFETLGVRAMLGRTLTKSDDVPGGERVVVLGHALWQRQWGGDRNIVGQTILLFGAPWTVVGVMGPEFALPDRKVDLYTPLWVTYPSGFDRGVHFLRPVFRLKPGVTAAAARADLANVFAELGRLHPEDDKGLNPEDLLPLLDDIVGDSRRSLAILIGAVGMVLLIACANLANLQLTNVSARTSELSIRAALGASRRRIVSQILVESALLAVLGGALGFLLSAWGVGALLSRFPEALPRLGNVGANVRVAGFTFAASLLTSVVFGIAPAWQAASGRFSGLLGRARSAGLRDGRARGGLVVSEIAIAMVLLVGAGLLLRTLWRLQGVPPGFQAQGVLAAHIDLPESRYEKRASQSAFRRNLLRSLVEEPGVRAAMVSEIPLSGNALDHEFVIDGAPPLAPGDEPSIYSRSMMGDYFGVMGIPLRAGRSLADSDREATEPVGVVNESMVRRYFAHSNPVGRRIRWARDEEIRWITIVGVVGDVRHFGLVEGEEPAVYTPYVQAEENWKRWGELVVRGPGGSVGLGELVRRKVRALDPLLPIARVRWMQEVVGDSLTRQRFNAELLSIFAAAALGLACVGIFGVMWSTVRRRRAEIGVRMALGAAPSRVVSEILVGGLRLIGLGIAIGVAAALALTRLMSSLLFGLPPTDPATFLGVALLLAAAAALACWIPARRAARVDPMTALRTE